MGLADDRTGLQLRSLVTADGRLELSLAKVEIPRPGPDEVVIRVEAAPINPSDLGLLLASADLETLKRSGTGRELSLTLRQEGSVVRLTLQDETGGAFKWMQGPVLETFAQRAHVELVMEETSLSLVIP